MRNAAGAPRGTAKFKRVPLGSGGFITGISFSNNGNTKAVRCDVHGAYVRGASDSVWRCTHLKGVIPDALIHADHTWDGNYTDRLGCAELVVAPGDSTFLMMNYDGYLLKSTDTGNTFVNTGAPRKILFSNNTGSRVWGRTLAIDPGNTNYVLYGTQGQDVLYSTNGGTTFSAIGLPTTFDAYNAPAGSGGYTAPKEPNGNGNAPHLVACDPTSTVSGGQHQIWYLTVHTVGVYKSTTGIAGPYTLMSGSPTKPMRLKVDQLGRVWAVQEGAINNLWKCVGGTWSQITNTVNNQFADVAVDPTDSNHVVAIDGLGKILRTKNLGTTWPDFWNNDTASNPPQQLMREKSIRYLDVGVVQQWQPITGNIDFDPVVSGKLWSATGVGIYAATIPTDQTQAFKWFGDSEGIEMLCCHCAIKPPGGNLIVGVHDQGIFTVKSLTRFVNKQGAPASPTDTIGNGGKHPTLIQPCTQLDYAADDPNWIAALHHGGFWSGTITNPHNGYSTDGGDTWNLWPTAPPNKPYAAGGGSMTVGKKNNVILLWNANAFPVYTKDGGTTWANLPLPGLPAGGTENGFEWQGNGYFLNKHLIDYDAVLDAFFLFNYGPPTAPSLKGIWKSTDKGDTWTQVYSGSPSPNYVYNVHLRCVPGQGGHLFFTAGLGFTETLYRSTDGGVSWSACTGIAAVSDLAFGKAPPGLSYPTIFFWGTVGGVYGLYRSDDNLATTVLLGSHPGNWLDYPAFVQGDPDVYGRCFIGFSGSGAMYCDYDFAGNMAA